MFFSDQKGQKQFVTLLFLHLALSYLQMRLVVRLPNLDLKRNSAIPQSLFYDCPHVSIVDIFFIKLRTFVPVCLSTHRDVQETTVLHVR